MPRLKTGHQKDSLEGFKAERRTESLILHRHYITVLLDHILKIRLIGITRIGVDLCRDAFLTAHISHSSSQPAHSYHPHRFRSKLILLMIANMYIKGKNDLDSLAVLQEGTYLNHLFVHSQKPPTVMHILSRYFLFCFRYFIGVIPYCFLNTF